MAAVAAVSIVFILIRRGALQTFYFSLTKSHPAMVLLRPALFCARCSPREAQGRDRAMTSNQDKYIHSRNFMIRFLRSYTVGSFYWEPQPLRAVANLPPQPDHDGASHTKASGCHRIRSALFVVPAEIPCGGIRGGRFLAEF